VYPELASLSPLVPPALPLSRQCIKRRSTPGRSRFNRSIGDQLLQLKSVLHVSATSMKDDWPGSVASCHRWDPA
jgi:hypothetical protein